MDGTTGGRCQVVSTINAMPMTSSYVKKLEVTDMQGKFVVKVNVNRRRGRVVRAWDTLIMFEATACGRS